MQDNERDFRATVVQQYPSRSGAGDADSTFVLTVTEGPEKGSSIRIDETLPTRLLIGTSPACQVRLTDPAVARRHAGLERVGHALKIADLGWRVIDVGIAQDVKPNRLAQTSAELRQQGLIPPKPGEKKNLASLVVARGRRVERRHHRRR